MSKIKEFKERIKTKWETAKIETKWNVIHALRWCADNPILAVSLISAGTTIISCGTKVASKALDVHNAKKENANKEYIYDRSTDAYYKLKHGPLTAKEALMVAELRECGYLKVEALNELNLIK